MKGLSQLIVLESEKIRENFIKRENRAQAGPERRTFEAGRRHFINGGTIAAEQKKKRAVTAAFYYCWPGLHRSRDVCSTFFQLAGTQNPSEISFRFTSLSLLKTRIDASSLSRYELAGVLRRH